MHRVSAAVTPWEGTAQAGQDWGGRRRCLCGAAPWIAKEAYSVVILK